MNMWLEIICLAFVIWLVIRGLPQMLKKEGKCKI